MKKIGEYTLELIMVIVAIGLIVLGLLVMGWILFFIAMAFDKAIVHGEFLYLGILFAVVYIIYIAIRIGVDKNAELDYNEEVNIKACSKKELDNFIKEYDIYE